MEKRYIQRAVGKPELRSLNSLARSEERAFFARNSHTIQPYRDRLLVVALCQGAALQHLGCGYGVNDFDVHFFYQQNPKKPRLSRTVKRIYADVGGFSHVAVDFIRTVVPAKPGTEKLSPSDRIRSFLRERKSTNAEHLSSKAVIGLLPSRYFAKELWPPAAEISVRGRARWWGARG